MWNVVYYVVLYRYGHWGVRHLRPLMLVELSWVELSSIRGLATPWMHFPIYALLSFWSTLSRGVRSTYWCCPSRPEWSSSPACIWHCFLHYFFVLSPVPVTGMLVVQPQVLAAGTLVYGHSDTTVPDAGTRGCMARVPVTIYYLSSVLGVMLDHLI